MSEPSSIDIVDIDHTFVSDVDQASRQSLSMAAQMRDRMNVLLMDKAQLKIFPQACNPTSAHQISITMFEKSVKFFHDFFMADHPSDLPVRTHVAVEAINNLFLNDHVWMEIFKTLEINQSRSKSVNKLKEELARLDAVHANSRDPYERALKSPRQKELKQRINNPPVFNDLSVDMCAELFWRVSELDLRNSIESTLKALSLPPWAPAPSLEELISAHDHENGGDLNNLILENLRTKIGEEEKSYPELVKARRTM